MNTKEDFFKRFCYLWKKAEYVYASIFNLPNDQGEGEKAIFCLGYLVNCIESDWQSLAMMKEWIKEGRPCLD
jgi:hypothetical protein